MEQLVEFVTHHILLVGLFVGVAAALGALVARDALSNDQVAPQEAVTRINRDGARVVDIRNKDQFVKGHIVDAINVPLADLCAEKLGKVSGHPLILVCESGHQSAVAHKKLSDWPEPVVRLRGGLAAWRNESLPVSRPRKGK